MPSEKVLIVAVRGRDPLRKKHPDALVVKVGDRLLGHRFDRLVLDEESALQCLTGNGRRWFETSVLTCFREGVQAEPITALVSPP
jgi:hypothetical protein